MNKFIVLLLFQYLMCPTLFAQADTSKLTADSGTYTRISKHGDYGLAVTRLILDLGEGSVIKETDITEGLFTVNVSENSAKSGIKIKGIMVTDRFGDSADSGQYVTIDLDFGLTDTSGNNSYTVILNKDLGSYHKGSQFMQKGRTIRR
jgi:hypothetical protein